MQTASEELGTPRDDLLSTRKIELKQKLLHLVPHTLSILTGKIEFQNFLLIILILHDY